LPIRISPARSLDLPVTYKNWTSVHGTINATSPAGATNQTVGLQWVLTQPSQIPTAFAQISEIWCREVSRSSVEVERGFDHAKARPSGRAF